MNNPVRYEGRSLKTRIGRLLGDQAMSDMKFLVGEALEEFPAHKLIFGASSGEFFNGFYAMTPADNIIKLPEIKVESFQEFLRYIYTEEADINPENVLDIMKLGDRYGIQHLMAFCFDRAVDFIDDQLHLFDDLLNFCKFAENDFLDMIAKDPLKYLTAENIEKLNKECLKVILEAKETKASETQLFDLAVMWAGKKTSADNPMQIRAFLGDLILLIRFPTMTLNEFEIFVDEHPGVLDAKDVIEIVVYISKQSGICKYPVVKRNMENVQTKKFTTNLKTYTKEFIISKTSFNKPAQEININQLYFSVRDACFLKSISFYVNGQYSDKINLQVIVTVCGPRANGVIQQAAANYSCSAERNSVDERSIDLEEKLVLDPKEFYSIQLVHRDAGHRDSNVNAASFKKIVLSLPKLEREGNIILSPKHKNQNQGSSVSSICYRLK